MQASIDDRLNPSLARASNAPGLFPVLALAGLLTTILLIMVGSIVRVTGNGLGCPDWPLCHGQAIPPFYASAWVEFSHRLFGGLVVLEALGLAWLSFTRYRNSRWMRGTAVFAGLALVLQVGLGGLHVIWELPRWTGWVHTGVAMLIAGAMALWVALSWPGLLGLAERLRPLRATRFPRAAAGLALGTYLLLLSGSLVTRSGASLVCPAFPHCGLGSYPDTVRLFVGAQMLHRALAIGMALVIALFLRKLYRAGGRDPALRRLAALTLGLVGLQIALGLVNIYLAIPMWSRVLHLGTGASIWVCAVILWALLRAEAPDGAAEPGRASLGE